jgi:hypothetical protein
VTPEIRAEPVAPLAAGAVRVRLSRIWRGVTIATTVNVLPGAALRGDVPVPGEPAPLPLDTGCAVARVTLREATETVETRVPVLRADGTVERDAQGAPLLRPGTVTRPVRWLDVVLDTPSGEPRTVSGKMTDG